MTSNINSSTEEKNQKIRRHFDEKNNEWYFSVVDIVEMITNSTDARNYWKVLKNRLKKAQNKLVTECNQVKMTSRDGKSYLTDAANSHTMIELIRLISPSELEDFDKWFDQINSSSKNINQKNDELSTTLDTLVQEDIAELPVDMYEDNSYIIIKSFIPCVAPENLSVSIGYENVIISGERINQAQPETKDYSLKEIFWGKFYRNIKLPNLIEIDKVETNFKYGLLMIRLIKIDLTRIKKIKIY